MKSTSELLKKPASLKMPALLEAVSKIESEVMEGRRGALETAVYMKAAKKIAEEVLKSEQLMSLAIDEVDEMPKDDRDFLGSTLKVSNGSTSYAYAADPIYRDLENQLNNRLEELSADSLVTELREKLQARKDLLDAARRAQERGGVVADDDGVLISPVPVKSYGKRTLSVTFGK